MKNLNQLPPQFVGTFIRQIKWIKIYGIDIFEETEASFIKRYGKLIFWASLLLSMLIGQVLYIVRRNEIGAQFLDIVASIPSIIMVLQDFMKIFVVSYKRDQIKNLILDIGEMWQSESDLDCEEKQETLNIWTGRLKLYDNAFFRAAIVSLIFFELLPVALTMYESTNETTVQYQFPLQLYYFCNIESYFQYALAYLYLLVASSPVHLCIYVSCDFLLVDLTFDLSALLSLVRIDLENIAPSDSSNYNFEEDGYEDIKTIAIKHQKLLCVHLDLGEINLISFACMVEVIIRELVSIFRTTNLGNETIVPGIPAFSIYYEYTLNQIFGEIIFSQVSFSSIVICCHAFMAVFADGMFLKNLTAALGIMFAIFILAWPGQMLSNTSSNVEVAAYQCPWYERGKKFRKCISIIMARSQKECRLSGLGFSDLTLAMFSKVMSTSWSYLSLLNQMYDNFDI